MTMSEKMIRVRRRMSDSSEGGSGGGATLTGTGTGPGASERGLAGVSGLGPARGVSVSAGAGRGAAFAFTEAVAVGVGLIACRGESISSSVSDPMLTGGMARKTVRQFLQRTGAPLAGRRASSNRYRDGQAGQLRITVDRASPGGPGGTRERTVEYRHPGRVGKSASSGSAALPCSGAGGLLEAPLDGVQDAVDELSGLLAPEALGDLDGLVDDHGGRGLGLVEELVDGDTEDVAVHRRHSLEAPVLRRLPDEAVDADRVGDRTANDALGEAAGGGIDLSAAPVKVEPRLRVVPGHVELEQDLEGVLPRQPAASHGRVPATRRDSPSRSPRAPSPIPCCRPSRP